jgi:hypothetical protein
VKKKLFDIRINPIIFGYETVKNGALEKIFIETLSFLNAMLTIAG